MTEITPAECRELAGLLGICWHEIHTELDPGEDGWMWSTCSCGPDKWSDHSLDKRHKNPDFTNPIVVLELMGPKHPEFIEQVFCIDEASYHDYVTRRVRFGKLLNYILDDTGLLANAALEWLRKEQGK